MPTVVQVRALGGQRLEFVSREASAHIKVRGFKIFPELIEAELIKHPEIEAAYCGAVTSSDLSSSDGESEDTDARLEAAVTLKDNSTLSSGTPAGIKMAACPV